MPNVFAFQLKRALPRFTARVYLTRACFLLETRVRQSALCDQHPENLATAVLLLDGVDECSHLARRPQVMNSLF